MRLNCRRISTIFGAQNSILPFRSNEMKAVKKIRKWYELSSWQKNTMKAPFSL